MNPAETSTDQDTMCAMAQGWSPCMPWASGTPIPSDSDPLEDLLHEENMTNQPYAYPGVGLRVSYPVFSPLSPSPLHGIVHPRELMPGGMPTSPSPMEEEWLPPSSQTLLASQTENGELRRQLADWALRHNMMAQEVNAMRLALAQKDQRIQELEHALQAQQNLDREPSWEDAQASLRAALGNANSDFTLTLETLKNLVHHPVQALPVCQALGKIPGRERDVLLHHMQYFYGTSPNVNRQYSPKDWGTWYGYLWRILRWIAAYADMPGPGPKLSVQAAADEIERLDARYDCDNNNEVIFFEDWNMKMETAQKKNKVSLTAHSRLQEKEFFYLHAWKRSGQSVNYGNRQVDRMEQLVQGCNVQV